MDFRPWLVSLLVLGLAGCIGDEPEDEPEPTLDETPTEVEGNQTVLPLVISSFEVNVTAGLPATANFTFNGTANVTWTFDANGDGTADANGTTLPASASFNYAEAGNYTALLELTRGNQTVNKTLLLAISAGEPIITAPGPEGGTVESTTTGVAGAQAIIGRTPFSLADGHAILEITTFLEDPLATEAGLTYTVRLTPPGGGDEDFEVAYGETIVYQSPAGGSWEIGIFPAGAGAWDWSADYCAFTTARC